MISVSGLTKYYGDYPAVQDVSFAVPRGKIVGFLGPNGAGKTTTMRILAGFLTATSGKASIAGFDVFWDPIEVRKRIGYLPENCPLYTEMRVREYLHFRAGIKGLYGSERSRRIDYVLGRCWLNDVQRQIIGTLSKGYRQRVGLADSLLASPPVLILDEPTAGLDPTQIISTRQLIRELGREHTILLSTHILPEVEATCDSVIIINKGRVAASNSLQELSRQAGDQGRLVVVMDGNIDLDTIRGMPAVLDFASQTASKGVKLILTSKHMPELSSWLCATAVQRGWKILEMYHERPSLEDLFVRITGPEAPSDPFTRPPPPSAGPPSAGPPSAGPPEPSAIRVP